MEIAHEVAPPYFTTNYQLLIYDIARDNNLPAAPSGHYVLSSPTGIINEGFDLSASGTSNFTNDYSASFPNFNSFIQELTNGNWNISVSSGANVTNYTFHVSTSGFDSSSLPDVNITFPTAGAVNVTNSPSFTWQGISWPNGNIQVEVTGSPTGFFERVILPRTQTSWTSPATLPEGDNNFLLNYSGSSATNITASVPLDSSSHPISAWTFQAFPVTYGIQAFSVTNAFPGHPGSTPLVARYTFDDGSLAATDVSGNGNDLPGPYSYSGAVAITNDSLEGAYAASINSADYYTDNTNLLSTLAGDFSVSLWLKTTQVYGNDTDAGIYNGAGIISTFAYNTPTGTNYVVPMELTGHKLAFVTVGGNGSEQDTLHSVTSIDTGNYVHVVVTRNHSTGEKDIYINGNLDASDIGTTDPLNGSHFLQIGLKNFQGFNGKLDDIQFYSTVLSAGQVFNIYQHPGSTAYTNSGAGPTLSAALDTTNLTWTTSGNANWFGETATSHDGNSAAQSGAITDSQATALQTTVPANGQVSFYWKVSSEQDLDFLKFYINGTEQDSISGDVDWTQTTYPVVAGDTLRWEYSKDESGSDGADAAWVDQVQFTTNAVSNAPVLVSLSLTLQRYNDFVNGTVAYYAYPYISSISPAPVTTNRIQSPDGVMFSEVWAGDTAEDREYQGYYTSLDQAVNACTNGQWTLYINKGAPNQQIFHFAVSINSLTTNFVGPVTILAPAPNAINVASNSPVQWSGPTNASYLFVEAYQTSPTFAYDGYTSLPASSTNWPSPPALLTGTNYCVVEYGLYNFSNFAFTTPVDGGLNPVASWHPGFYIYTTATSKFVVRSPLAVELSATPTQVTGDNFQLGFQTVAGHQETVQMRTNLFVGTWIDVTNFVGDGSAYQLTVSMTNSPDSYFRVITQ